jgi:hypothetical protein
MLKIEKSFIGKDTLKTYNDIVRMLENHPWVKVNDKGYLKIYTLNFKEFSNWLKTAEGTKYSCKGCGDDSIYTVSEFLRTYMPRGLAVYNDEIDFFVIRGFRKFTGIDSTDEDEDSGATYTRESFMYNGSTMGNCSYFVSTEKSNGENGKWAIRRCKDGSYIIFAGSKNAMRYWKLGETIEFDLSKYIPSEEICKWVYNYCQTMSDEFLNIIVENEFTLMFEINHPDSEHVFPIDEMRMDFVSILDSNGLPIDCKTAFGFFSQFKLPHVSYSIHSQDQLNEIIQITRNRTDTEGIVIYLYNAENECIGLIKVKTDYYVVARAIRECFKHFQNKVFQGKLIDGPIQNKKIKNQDKTLTIDVFLEVEKRIKKRMWNMNHLHNYKERYLEWIESGLIFLNYWKTNYLCLSTNETRIQYVHESKQKYGTLFHNAMQNHKYMIVDEFVNEFMDSLFV